MELTVFFKDSNNNNLCGILSKPTENKGKIIILAHGFLSNKNTRSWILLTDLLNSESIASFRIDLFAHGESEGNFEDLTTSKVIDSILSAINFVKSQGYRKIGLVGSSFGGLASLMVASKSSDLLFLALKSPVSTYEETWIDRIRPHKIEEWKLKGIKEFEDEDGTYKLKYDFFEDIKNNRAQEVAHQIKIPTLIVHGDQDTVVPIEQSKKTSSLIPNCKLMLVHGAGHIYQEGAEMEQLVKTLNNFIIQQFRA